MAEATLTFDADYAPDGSIGMTLTVTGGAMSEPGPTFTGTGKLAGSIPFTFEGQGPPVFGDFGLPTADGWTVEPDGVPNFAAATARFIARPAS